MRAARHDRYGPPDVVRIEVVRPPVPTGDQVLVRVEAASVNRADLDALYPRWAFIRLFAGLRRPRDGRVGVDVAGVVEAVGPAARQLKQGERVFGDLFKVGQAGAFAEYVCVPERAFLPIPEGMPSDVAACLPHSAVLALQALRHPSGRSIGPGTEVLVVGASGNVGPFAVQIARSMGARVTGVASAEKLDFVRSLGADEVVDYRATDYTRSGRRWDWIVDVDAHHGLLRWRAALKPGGVYAALGGSGGWLVKALLLFPLTFVGRRRLGMMLWWKPMHAPDVARLVEMVAAGQLRPVIDRSFTLEQVVDALRWVDEGRARGKVLVIP